MKQNLKQIVVAIDFSKNSFHALDYAIGIANVIKANIMMIWVDKPDNEDSLYDNTNHEHRMEAKNRMEELVKKTSKKLKYGELSYKLRKGKVYKEVANQAKYNDAFLIIAGSHGVSGFESFWIGSNANKIVTYSPCPVITIRETYKPGKSIDKIILPIDSTPSTRQKVPFAMEFARYFKSEVHVLELQSSTLKTIRSKVSSYTVQVVKFLKDNKIKAIHKTVDADNITNATAKYGEEIKADLIIIMTEQEEEFSNYWLGPYAQQMVNNSAIPVMSVHPKELNKLAK